jgi:hypothetical protein
VEVQFRVIDLVIVTPPNPPGSRQLISPKAAVLEIAPAKVLHGAVRLQGLASSPTPDTHVREACAYAGADAKHGRTKPTANVRNAKRRIMKPSFMTGTSFRRAETNAVFLSTGTGPGVG